MTAVSAPSEHAEHVAAQHRRAVAAVLAALGLVAVVLALVDVRNGVAGTVRVVVTPAFLLLGPGWAAAGFLRRVRPALLWIVAAGLGVALGALAATVMLGPVGWHPVGALVVTAVVTVPVLVGHAVALRWWGR